jgi:hemerythrin
LREQARGKLARIPWNENFSVNEEFIDQQNRKMLAIINDYYESMQKGTALTVFESIIERIIDYSKTLHKYEEELMKSIGFSDLQAHQQAHIDLTSRAEQELEKYRRDKSNYSYHDLSALLKEWLVRHILTQDQKIKDYL